MEESTMVLYREIQERYVKVLWTHKIQLCQAAISSSKAKRRNYLLSFLSVFVSASAITHIFKWLPDVVILPLMAIISLVLTFFTIYYKTENLAKAAADNERFAATMHHLRNRYAGLLSDIKSGVLTNKQIVEIRKALENDENLIYSGIVPATSDKAVEMANKALKISQDSTTTDDEIATLISQNLQV